MSPGLRVLWLTPEAPSVAGGGGAIRSYHQLDGLARRGVRSTVVAPALLEQARQAKTPAELDAELRLVRRPRSQTEEALRGLEARPALALDALRQPWLALQAGVFWTRIGPVAKHEAASGRHDAVVVEHDFAAAWAAELPAELPALMVFHNASWRYYERLDTLRGCAEAYRFRSFLRAELPRFTRGIAMSDAEREEIRELAPALTVDVVPNGVDTSRLGAAMPGSGKPGALVFIGTLSYAPNAQGVVWFCEEVLPLVRAERPDVTFTIVGRGAPESVQALASHPGVTLTGWVEDVVPYMEAAQVAVAPLRMGAGSNLKVIEALAAGRPLVATRRAAQGFDVHDGEDLLVADESGDFARAVLQLLGDEKLRLRLGTRGRALAQADYDWDALAERMNAALEEWLT
jgi:glycosyltransferase involved in cell wall biosynthesis